MPFSPIETCPFNNVTSIAVVEEVSAPLPKIIESKWINQDSKLIKSSMPTAKVKIELTTEGIVDDETVTVLIIDEKENKLQSVEIKVSDNKAISDDIEIPKAWVDHILQINVEKGNKYEETHLGSKLNVSNLTITELRFKIVDCRANTAIRNARTSKVAISYGETKVEKIFDLKKDAKALSTSTKVKSSMEALQKLGYGESDVIPKNNYDETWHAHYNKYWADRSAAFHVAKLESGNPPDNMMKFIIEEYNSHRATDSSGILTVKIPTPMLDEHNVEVEVGFFDFPVVLERINGDSRTNSVLRSNENDATEFKIKWRGPQSTGWGGNFGWVIHSGRVSEAEFKVSETIKIKNDLNKFEKFDPEILSSFYDADDNSSPHFHLLAMEWCQCVWDGIDDPEEVGINEYSCVENADYANLNMHIVTTYFDIGGSDPYGGKGYGKSEVRNSGGYLWRSAGHRGLDIHANLGDNIYAVHGGKLTRGFATKVGNKLTVTWTTPMSANITYLHLNGYVDGIPENYAMAGRIVAYAGRTGNLGAISEWPGHVHLNVGATPVHVIGLRTTLAQLHDDNLNVVIPNNDYPMLFPCRCAVTSATQDPSGCEFDNTTFATPCWAVHELKCPYMLHEGRRNRRIQAQLKHLSYYSSSLDGLWGNLPNNNTPVISNTRQAIYNFKADNNLLVIDPTRTFIPEDYDMTAAEEAILNLEAPVTRVQIPRPPVAPPVLQIPPLPINERPALPSPHINL
ncbi:hypothetical protein [Prevotella sp. 10(H)]|uniref:hypothetical protein n=1 Tax=Prevotella sp. 10(H) TaxID=1158294 RepID=UPI0004A6DBAF|nr:hypothetical protein [Prevotella sp. 10(H)]